MALQVAAATGAPRGPIHEAMQRACAGGGGGVAHAAAAGAAVRCAAAADGPAVARAVAAPLLRAPGAGEPLHAAMLGLEAAAALHAAATGAPDAAAALAAARRAAEAAVAAHGEDEASLWGAYLRLERDAGAGHAAAGRLFWRAKKALRDAAPLTAAYGALAV